MHGMMNRAIQCFLRDTYGEETWKSVADRAELGFDNFEAMLSYPDEATMKMLSASAMILKKPFEILLEDLGTYLVSHPNVEAIRRLLRFGGDTFVEFLFSLNELQGRARLALPDLEIPKLSISYQQDGTYSLGCEGGLPGFGYAMVGVMRTMADDYGALVYLEHLGWKDSGEEEIIVYLLEAAFSEGREFALSKGIGGVA